MYQLDPQEIARAQVVFDDAATREATRRRLKIVTVAQLIDEAALIYSVTPGQIKGRSRTGYIVEARHWVMYHARAAGRSSLPDIGRRIGGRDHTTVIHGANKHAERHDLDKPWRGPAAHDAINADRMGANQCAEAIAAE